MTVSDKALAQAFREAVRDWNTEAHWTFVHQGITQRARELDAEKGGDASYVLSSVEVPPGCTVSFEGGALRITPPAQAAEAVERVARAMWDDGEPENSWDDGEPENSWDDGEPENSWDEITDEYPGTADNYRKLARAAIAAMSKGEENK